LWVVVGGGVFWVVGGGGVVTRGRPLAASFLALFVHALFYSGFLEDPITWLVLAVGAGWLAWGDALRTPAERSTARAVAGT
jgi:hypothetical protein